MTTNSSSNDIISRAGSGDPKAIAQLMNIALQPQQIVIRATGINNRLTIFAKGPSLPNQESLIGIIERGFKDLEIASIESVKVYGKSSHNSDQTWAEEISFSEGSTAQATNTSSRKTSLILASVKRRLFALWKRLRSLVQRLAANKRFMMGLIGLAIVGLLASGGLAGFRFVQARSAYAQTMSEAQTLVSEATPSESDSLEQLEDKLTQMKQARQLLRSVPESQSASYRSAQVELQKISQNVERINGEISDVKSISGKLAAADEVVQDAIAKVNQPPYAVEDWNEAKRELAKGVAMMEAIPQYGAMASEVEGRLKTYQDKLAWMNKAIANEQAGVTEVAKANEIALAAYNLTNGRDKFTVGDLAAARDKWQAAIDQVKTVPATTNAYRSVSDRISTYTENKNEILDGIYEISNCSYKNSDSEYLRASCNDVYMYLTKPEL